MEISRQLSILCVTALFWSGCGGATELKVLPVTGTLTVGGSPVEGIKVVLEPRDPKTKAPLLSGMTDATGKFEIQTSAGQKGAPAGQYKVVLLPKAADFDYSKAGKGGPKVSVDVIPKNYQSSTTTELSHEVKAAGPPLDIKVP